jgi:hypothetical protein
MLCESFQTILVPQLSPQLSPQLNPQLNPMFSPQFSICLSQDPRQYTLQVNFNFINLLRLYPHKCTIELIL